MEPTVYRFYTERVHPHWKAVMESDQLPKDVHPAVVTPEEWAARSPEERLQFFCAGDPEVEYPAVWRKWIASDASGPGDSAPLRDWWPEVKAMLEPFPEVARDSERVHHCILDQLDREYRPREIVSTLRRVLDRFKRSNGKIEHPSGFVTGVLKSELDKLRGRTVDRPATIPPTPFEPIEFDVI